MSSNIVRRGSKGSNHRTPVEHPYQVFTCPKSQHKQTLGEGVLQVFGVVRFFRTSSNYTTGQVFIVVQSFRTSSNYTTGCANTWLGCSTGVRCGSILPILFELHYWRRKHLVRVFYRCSAWFDPSDPLRTTLLDRKHLVRDRTTPNTCRTP